MKITIPELSLVVLVGPSGAGKSTFARKHFKATEVLSSDFCRWLVSDDENSQAATNDAFEVLHFISAKRLAASRLTVVDATNVQPEARKPLVALARQYHCLPVAIVFDLPEKICHERNRERPDRDFGPHVIRQQTQQMRRSLRGLEREGFRHVFVLASLEDVEKATVERQPLWNNRRDDHGPFDIIGDIHGCRSELETLLGRLGYDVGAARHPDGRKVVFLGDLVDRGPDIPGVLRIVMKMVEADSALCVPGNHEMKLLRKLRGKDVQITHGLAESVAQLEREPPEFRKTVMDFIDHLVSHYVLDDGKLVVAHAGMKESMQGRGSGKVRDFALFGETTGETDEFGLPIRYNWASEYRGRAMVVYGHTPVPEPECLNSTINIDTGCVFGGRLTALRYPEKEIVSVPAERTWCQPAKPILEQGFQVPALTAQQEQDDVLDMEDVLGKRIVTTRLHHTVTVREENAIAALEVMSRFAANPKWLIYLPPTMSPSDTAPNGGLLEHPAQAFAYYRHEGIPKVICEEKHMGSRAVIIVCRDTGVARRRFGIVEDEDGIVYTRTGRRFFDDLGQERGLLDRIRRAADQGGIWDELATDWLCLDCELMPWSAKAQELLRTQYAAVGAASRAALREAFSALERAAARGVDIGSLRERTRDRAQLAEKYVDTYCRYCWPVTSLEDLRVAPFHLLASEGKVHIDRSNSWHMEILAKLSLAGDSILMATSHQVVDVTDAASEAEGVRWWDDLTARGGEGMVVKPMEFVARGRRGIAQPAVKCRGPEYLRIIYGMEYTLPEHLERLRSRGLSAKRSLALREFALGIEALERFVRKEPLRRVHECVFGVLALESEPVDPRL
ncbi:polynucleotide kinase-phosphatase [Candidatus Accumulibacter contiguus]|jgi:protein phosphatase|uniref:polynucleotide kinase-phosphatase n=1 Tax=Candidatus Accumulibacter contiguus TaxID=2954381 RepID=UPI002FC3BA63